MSADNTSGSFTMLYSQSQFVNNFYKYSTLVINHAGRQLFLRPQCASQNKKPVSIINTFSLASVSISRRMVKTSFMRSEKYIYIYIYIYKYINLLFFPTLTKTGMLTHFSRSPKYGSSRNSIQ